MIACIIPLQANSISQKGTHAVLVLLVWDIKSDMAVSLNRSYKGVLLEWLNICLGKS